MTRKRIAVIVGLLVYPVLVFCQSGKRRDGEEPPPEDLVGAAAYETYIAYNRAFQTGGVEVEREGKGIVIPSKYWAEPIKAVKAIKVYTHVGVNIVVVLRVHGNIEEGKYIHIPISNDFIPRNGYDGFEFTPNPYQGDKYIGYTVVSYKRIRDK